MAANQPVCQPVIDAGLMRRALALWRPFLRDPADDMVLELAIAAQARYIVTHNLRDFDRTISMGVVAESPGDFFQRIQSGEFL